MNEWNIKPLYKKVKSQKKKNEDNKLKIKNVKTFYFYYFFCGVQKRLKFHFALIFFPTVQEIRNLF